MTSRSTRPVVAAVLGLLLLAAGPARATETDSPANSGALDLRLFRAAVDSKGLFGVNATDVMPHLDISIALVLDYGHNLFDVTALDAAGATCDANLVSDAIDVSLGFNIGLFNFAEVGFSLPVVILSGPAVRGVAGWEGWGGDPPPIDTPSFSAQHVGDLEVHGKFRWLRVERHPVGVGTIIQFFTPTGQADRALGSDPGMGLGVTAVLDTMPTDWFLGSLNLGARFFFAHDDGYEPLKLTDAGGNAFEYGHLLTFGLGGSFTLVPERLNAIVEFYGNTVLSGDFFDLLHTPMELVAGLKIFIERNSYLYIGGGTGVFSPGFSAADVRLFGAWIFEPSIGDRDRDGIKDDVDQCPDEPEDRDDFEDLDGCPDPDNDRDQILDIDDSCPLIPEDRDGDADEDGCPDGEQGDRDGDTIPDTNDVCPDDPEDLDGFQDAEGCPDPDNDNDTIPDIADECPNEPEDIDGFQDVDGCPDVDNDQDRILDVDDDCPNEPESYNGTEDDDGCPDTGTIVVTDREVILLEKIMFETDSAVILPESFDLLNRVAATLNSNMHIQLIEVQGHADERNSDEYNITLTHDRANSVVEYMVRQGVDAGRLLAAGYGERCPVDRGHSESAWDKNRRVEFKILWTTAGPMDTVRSCPAAEELQPPLPPQFQPGGAATAPTAPRTVPAGSAEAEAAGATAAPAVPTEP
ncbi:MAG: OmpA family protein [Deltaproteobacteria bacterium]|nr:OmpA family protein [Deltaproteobacteria bacterium]